MASANVIRLWLHFEEKDGSLGNCVDLKTDSSTIQTFHPVEFISIKQWSVEEFGSVVAV